MWAKGGKEESFIEVETLKIQKSGTGTGNARNPGDGGMCRKERRKEGTF